MGNIIISNDLGNLTTVKSYVKSQGRVINQLEYKNQCIFMRENFQTERVTKDGITINFYGTKFNKAAIAGWIGRWMDRGGGGREYCKNSR